MLVIKQNGRSKLGRTGNGIHMETNKNMETLNAVWLTAEQAGWRSVHMAVLILSVPCSPLSFYPLSEIPLPRGCSDPGKGTQSEFMERYLEPELVHPSQDQPHWERTSLCGEWGSGEDGLPSIFCLPVETRPQWGDSERLSTELQHPALKPG